MCGLSYTWQGANLIQACHRITKHEYVQSNLWECKKKSTDCANCEATEVRVVVWFYQRTEQYFYSEDTKAIFCVHNINVMLKAWWANATTSRGIERAWVRRPTLNERRYISLVKVAAELANAASGYLFYTRQYTWIEWPRTAVDSRRYRTIHHFHTGRNGSVAICRGARKESNFGFIELARDMLTIYGRITFSGVKNEVLIQNLKQKSKTFAGLKQKRAHQVENAWNQWNAVNFKCFQARKTMSTMRFPRVTRDAMRRRTQYPLACLYCWGVDWFAEAAEICWPKCFGCHYCCSQSGLSVASSSICRVSTANFPHFHFWAAGGKIQVFLHMCDEILWPVWSSSVIRYQE